MRETAQSVKVRLHAHRSALAHDADSDFDANEDLRSLPHVGAKAQPPRLPAPPYALALATLSRFTDGATGATPVADPSSRTPTARHGADDIFL